MMDDADDPYVVRLAAHPLGYAIGNKGKVISRARRTWLQKMLDEQGLARNRNERQALVVFLSQLKRHKTYRHYYCLTTLKTYPHAFYRETKRDPQGVSTRIRYFVNMTFEDLKNVGQHFCSKRIVVQAKGGRKIAAPLFGAMSVVEEKEVIELSLSRIFFDLLSDSLPEDPRMW